MSDLEEMIGNLTDELGEKDSMVVLGVLVCELMPVMSKNQQILDAMTDEQKKCVHDFFNCGVTVGGKCVEKVLDK